MQPSFELFDHTADIGVRVLAPSRPSLVEPATEGLYAVMGKVIATGGTTVVPFDLSGDDAAMLLRDYLAEVLFAFEQGRRKVVSVEVADFSDERLVATARVAPVDEERSAYHREVKAVTYHELAVRKVPGGYEAVYIVDV